MRDFPSCFGENGVQVADSSSSNSSKNAQNLVTCVYQCRIRGRFCLITITWSRNLMGQGLSVGMDDSANHCLCKVDIKPWQMVLLLGDMRKEAFKKTSATLIPSNAVFVSKREHVFGKKVFSTKAQFCDNGQIHDLVIECDTIGISDPCLVVRVDCKTVMQVKRLLWKFRGNHTILVDGLAVEVLWDVHNWLFGTSVGNAVFMFKTCLSAEKLWSSQALTDPNVLPWSFSQRFLDSKSQNLGSDVAFDSVLVLQWIIGSSTVKDNMLESQLAACRQVIAVVVDTRICGENSRGSISVYVCGDQGKPALITYPDVALNYMSCFQGLFVCPEAASLLLHNFCIYHIDAPGHELGADVISSDVPLLSVDDLADQVAEVLDFFRLKEVLCLGVTAGAYVLTLFAMKYKERVLGLILVSPICKAPSWTEWLYNKVLLNLLYIYGMCGVLKECLIQRYFSKEIRCGVHGAESDIIQDVEGELMSVTFDVWPQLLDERQSLNVMRFLQAINKRHDLTDGLKELQCKTLIFVGESSQFHDESVYMSAKMGKKSCALVEVQACGSLVTEEHPYAMIIPMEFFLMGFGYHRPHFSSSSSNGSNPASPLSHSCIAPELLSPESLGIKLKPIKTRVNIEV
ncbi:hypothetical protein GH714_002811 [Hevea brasiliensis]|uniref:Uncharacterized protein n=1 Tax=Hevea brasiliensis TaxID=3981 RepID=A0A6A6KIC9_HEVBR|nr:hypothetical protein GH714_002811 [Hevea brasiliensis]